MRPYWASEEPQNTEAAAADNCVEMAVRPLILVPCATVGVQLLIVNKHLHCSKDLPKQWSTKLDPTSGIQLPRSK